MMYMLVELWATDANSNQRGISIFTAICKNVEGIIVTQEVVKLSIWRNCLF